jgi:hypothetical protein
MNARKLAGLLVVALALVAAGCGGSSNDASSDTATVAVETTTTEATTTEATTTEATATTDDSATDTTSNVDVGALTGKCAELAGLGSKLTSAMGGQDAGVQDVSKLFDELADQVPDEIRADWQVLAENFGKIAEALKGVDLTSGKTPDAETLAKLQELSTTLDSQKVQQAAAHIEAWVTENC